MNALSPVIAFYRFNVIFVAILKIHHQLSDMFLKVQALEQIVFYLVPNSDLWIYVLRPEDVFFMHYDLWPRPMPFIFRHDRHTMTQDVLIKKELGFVKSKSCNSESAYTGTYFI